jgi:hypothetical protein
MHSQQSIKTQSKNSHLREASAGNDLKFGPSWLDLFLTQLGPPVRCGVAAVALQAMAAQPADL